MAAGVLVSLVVLGLATMTPSGAATMTTLRYRPATARPVSHTVLAKTAAILETRARALGATGATATVVDGVIVVKVPTTAATAALSAALQEPGTFFFRQVVCGAPSYTPPMPGATRYLVPPTCAAAYRYPTMARPPAAGATFTTPSADPIYAAYPTTPASLDATSATDNVILRADSGAPGSRFVLGPALATGSIIDRCRVAQDRTTDASVVLCILTPSGSSQFNMMANRHFGQMIAEDLDGVVLAAPIIEATNFGGTFQVSSNFTRPAATAIAAELNAPSLPVALTAA
jgi:preprotein translocase subunit SecD